ncbi:MAG: hypothetical protein M3Q79_01490 [bacterium]|nr:hypothetical protein [bacterium]
MYCESAGKECAYLEIVDRQAQDLLLARGTEKLGKVIKAVIKYEDIVADLRQASESECGSDYCAVVGQTILNGIASYAHHTRRS